MKEEEKKAVWSTARLVLGIIAIVLFIFIMFQSCAAGLGNALEESNEFSGTSGFLLALFLLAGGITGVATRKSLSCKGLFAAGILFVPAAVLGGTSWNSTYSDLKIWTIVSLLFAAFYFICGIKTKKL